MDWPLIALLDDVLLQVQTSSPQRVLFWGDGAGGISSYVAGWMAGKEIDVILLDGANRFNPYMVSSFARKALIPPERLLRRIRIARAFTCYQMATLMGEKLRPLLKEEKGKPWVIVLGPITTFLDEDVPEREARPLFERALRKVEGIAIEGIPFFLFQPAVFSEKYSPLIRLRQNTLRLATGMNGGRTAPKLEERRRVGFGGIPLDTPPQAAESFIKKGRSGLTDSRRTYLTKRLLEFSDLVWKIEMEDEEPKLILEKGLKLNIIGNCKLQNEKCKI